METVAGIACMTLFLCACAAASGGLKIHARVQISPKYSRT